MLTWQERLNNSTVFKKGAPLRTVADRFCNVRGANNYFHFVALKNKVFYLLHSFVSSVSHRVKGLGMPLDLVHVESLKRE